MQEREADRLLDLHVAVDLDVGPLPVGVEVHALGLRQAVPTLGDGVLEGRIDLVAQELDRLL